MFLWVWLGRAVGGGEFSSLFPWVRPLKPPAREPRGNLVPVLHPFCELRQHSWAAAGAARVLLDWPRSRTSLRTCRSCPFMLSTASRWSWRQCSEVQAPLSTDPYLTATHDFEDCRIDGELSPQGPSPPSLQTDIANFSQQAWTKYRANYPNWSISFV